jgi:uncharacterized protein YukE
MSFLPDFVPDPGQLRVLAGRINQHASATRARADRLGFAVADAGWQGVAARAFQGQAHIAVDGLRLAAGRLDDAADALRRHADNVGRLLGELEALAQAGLLTAEELLERSGAVLHGVGKGIGHVVHAGTDLVDGALDVVGL